MRLRPILAILAFLVAATSVAADRPFPQQTKRGTMTPANFPQIVIDGQTRHLAPAARIWNADNFIEMPAALRGSDFTVNYTEDMNGDIDRVWILSADEARESLQKQTNSQLRQ
ncbi:hypothetical protein [Noviherbaspirillum galbum]|uniref:Uncharacterized protein n=1 Tax=Noviherbaspirillum galbum TaxID=2709383 RepID=A0A6B3SQZ5_9BURK|nr:hypothetical protein [Noviherbaspirillum galbum]NEX60832.1 hypothetical protein [Noviherbaspirillum galbum]